MAEFNLKMIKIFFLVVIAMLVLAMTSGMNILRGDKVFSWQKMKMEADFIKYKRALAAQGADASQNPAPNDHFAKSIPVLLYHGVIADPNWKKDDTNIALSDFQGEMFALKKEGYQTVTLSDFSDFMKNGKPLPEKSFLLTFDDGRKDSYYPVDPILKALDYNAVIFVITGQSFDQELAQRNDFYLNQAELVEMKKNGRWEIESHGAKDHDWMNISEDEKKGHFLSNRLWLAPEKRLETELEAQKRILGDLASSKLTIEKSTREKVLAFAYPYNDFGQESENFPEARDFIRGQIGNIYPLTFIQVADDDAAGNYPDPNQLFVKRIDVNANMASKDLLGIVERNQEKNLPYFETFWADQGWVSRWGSEKVWGDLALADEENEKSGNLTVLLGTQSWRNYNFQATFQMEQGNSISQVVRYQNDENFLSCNFSTAETSITERIGGKESILAEMGAVQNFSAGAENKIESLANENYVSCSLNGERKIEAKTSGKLETGGIGFSIWDELPVPSQFFIKKVEVSSPVK